MSFRKAREKAGLTVIEVSKTIGVTPQAIYLWETGKNAAPSSRLREIAALYGTTVDFLLVGNEEESKN